MVVLSIQVQTPKFVFFVCGCVWEVPSVSWHPSTLFHLLSRCGGILEHDVNRRNMSFAYWTVIHIIFTLSSQCKNNTSVSSTVVLTRKWNIMEYQCIYDILIYFDICWWNIWLYIYGIYIYMAYIYIWHIYIDMASTKDIFQCYRNATRPWWRASLSGQGAMDGWKKFFFAVTAI